MKDIALLAFILSRVSSDEQAKGYSLDAQEKSMERYCDYKELKITKRFQLVESSTQGNRKQFNEIITLIRKQHTKIALVADRLDRIQRNQRETPILDELIKQGKLEIHLVSEGLIIDQNANAHIMMAWGIGVVFARAYTDILSDNVKKGFKQKVELAGEWWGLAPLGYLNKKDEKASGRVVLDPLVAPIVKKIFEEYATGSYTIGEITRKAQTWGLRSKKGLYIVKSAMSRLLQHPFYYGEMSFKGELFSHCHEPLITRELFKACEAVRMNWNTKPFKLGGKEFLFRGMFKCAVTNRVVTAYTRTKKYKNGTVSQWTYLRTWDSQNPTKEISVREDDVIRQIEHILKGLKIKNPEILKQTMEYLKCINKSRTDEISNEVKVLRDEHTKIQNKLTSYMDLVAEKVITREEFLHRKTELKERQYELNELINSYDDIDDKLSKKLLDFICVMTNAYETFKGSSLEEKREFLNFVFSNLTLKDGKVLYTLAFPFNKLQEVSNCSIWRE